MESFCNLTVKEWAEFSFGILGALGSIVTVAGLYFLYDADKSQQEQINSLKGMVEKLTTMSNTMNEQLQVDKEALLMNFRPFLKMMTYIPSGNRDSIFVEIWNLGKSAFVIMGRDVNDCFKEQFQRKNFNLLGDSKIELRFILQPEFEWDKSSLVFNIYYQDEMKNYYKATIIGDTTRGTNHRLIDGQKLTPQEMKEYNLS